jgi:CHAD domain-containing protein
MSPMEWNGRAGAGANAKRELPRMMSDYFVQVREALRAKASPAKLHKIRLAGKKVRYTLELFRPCYGAGFDERMAALKNVQTALGDVNDAVAAARLIGDAMPRSARRKALRAYLKKRAAGKAEHFRVHWTETFDAEGQERLWLEFLRNPRQPKAHGRRAALT